MSLGGLFNSIERTLLSKYSESSFIKHSGDKGENREEFLRDFLSENLPKKFGVAKGEIITNDGIHSHSADIIIYDAINCPLLFSGKTKILPIEGVYGIIEVKSGLSKEELVIDCNKIAKFKSLAPGVLSFVETSKNVIAAQFPSAPFGIILSYSLRNTSLESLLENLAEKNYQIPSADQLVNFVAVLGQGIIRHEQVNFSIGEKFLLIDTDDLMNFLRLLSKRRRNNEEGDEIILRMIVEHLGDNTFGRFYVYLLTILLRMKLNIPDLGSYLDPDLSTGIPKA
jgi:hypothetical protein